MAKIGDTVRYLNATGGGKIVKIEGNIAYVDEDGFETPVLLRECVVVATAGSEPSKTTFVKVKEEKTMTPVPEKVEQPRYVPEPELPVEETPEGNSINLVLAFEPVEPKKLSETEFDAFIVNDSNYYISYYVAVHADDNSQWSLLSTGVIEPNIQQLIATIERSRLPQFDHILVQYFAYKQQSDFEVKRPASVEFAFDTTKFFKLHCFKQNIYFDTDVIALDVVKDDKPMIRGRKPDGEALRKAMLAKKRVDSRPVKRPVVKRNDRKNGDVIEVDLHINELLDSTRGLSNADILNCQIDEFRRVMDENLKNKGQKIVFIHGKGEGVLRQALIKELNHRYKNHDVQDASFREYGFGATQVTIR